MGQLYVNPLLTNEGPFNCEIVHFFQQLHPGDGHESIQVAVSMAQQEGIQVVNAATGETIHIESQANEDGSLQINASPVQGEVLQGEDGTLHITSQGNDGTLHIQAEDGTTQEIKVQND